LGLLVQLDGMRRTVLSVMESQHPALVESLLWQDAAAQQVLLQQKAQQQKQQQQSGQGPSLQQKQGNKQLVAVVLLSQTAACLLHYGISVAHMFLQHGLQRLPSVCDACKPALAALAEANDAVEQQPHTAAGSGAHSSTDNISAAEHPKLAQLQDLVLRLKARQPVSALKVACMLLWLAVKACCMKVGPVPLADSQLPWVLQHADQVLLLCAFVDLAHAGLQAAYFG
jgi:hypothetical protein